MSAARRRVSVLTVVTPVTTSMDNASAPSVSPDSFVRSVSLFLATGFLVLITTRMVC